MPSGRKRNTCECGNERQPGEQTCPNCQELDGTRRLLNGEMARRHAQENREQKALLR